MSLYSEAIERFQSLLERARAAGVPEPTAFTLATCGSDGMPAARTVLLKEVSERGFVFYTNMQSRKGRQLAENPRAALCFHWQALAEQVLVQGKVTQVADAEADAYWATRPRLSQLGAWASQQSQPLASRAELEARLAEVEKRFEGGPVPRPPYWSGYRVAPDFIEFWYARPGRLHERQRYTLENGEWRVGWISP